MHYYSCLRITKCKRTTNWRILNLEPILVYCNFRNHKYFLQFEVLYIVILNKKNVWKIWRIWNKSELTKVDLEEILFCIFWQETPIEVYCNFRNLKFFLQFEVLYNVILNIKMSSKGIPTSWPRITRLRAKR